MAEDIQNSCAKILSSVRNSNLNYSSQETPFSIYMTVRKSWNRKSIESRLSDYSEPSSEIVLRENLVLKAELADLKTQLEISKNITSEIETKMAAAESEVYQLKTGRKHWPRKMMKL